MRSRSGRQSGEWASRRNVISRLRCIAAFVLIILIAAACGSPSSADPEEGCPPAASEAGAERPAESTTSRDDPAASGSRADLSSASARDSLRWEVDELRRRNQELRDRFAGLQPQGKYIVANTTLNRFQLRMNGSVILDALCSTGSGSELVSPGGRRRWVFNTPKGVFQVRRRMVAPVWFKPDWAFIEEGVPVPPVDSPERQEGGVLGMYGLCFGDGYLIHGTLFDRFLGQSVTHGCIRLGDEDLEAVYKASVVGTPIYIY